MFLSLCGAESVLILQGRGVLLSELGNMETFHPVSM